jgi:uncharacterized protein YlzI (FlbEa/FlbD family)
MATFVEFVTGDRGEIVCCVNADIIRLIHPNPKDKLSTDITFDEGHIITVRNKFDEVMQKLIK